MYLLNTPTKKAVNVTINGIMKVNTQGTRGAFLNIKIGKSWIT